GATLGDIVPTPTENDGCAAYQVSFTVTVPTLVLSTAQQLLHLGKSDFNTLNIFSQVTRGLSCTQQAHAEVTLVLDNTGSMNDSLGGGQTKLAALKTAATDLTNILFGSSATLNNLHISVVPYDVEVVVGSTHSQWVKTSQMPSTWGTNGWTWSQRFSLNHNG